MTTPASRWRTIPIDALVKASWNYKADDDDMAAKLLENIRRNGQIQNLIVRALSPAERAGYTTAVREVVNGNHRLEAFRALGLKDAVCYDLGLVSAADAKRIAIETNETYFAPDHVKLADLLREIAGPSPDLAALAETLPFDVEALGRYVAMPAGHEPVAAPPPDSETAIDRRATKMRNIAVTEEQFETIGRGIEALRTKEGDETISEGRAIELVVADWLS